ncbi:MAG TPA: peptidoglycan-binding domain-containing protein, partial [Methylibium sp.]|uniref:peptidoglycan-binding domain-containing protein n=1 Tax=Methylibium sp. TaxID=2067992 RepID=UPI002DBFF344
GGSAPAAALANAPAPAASADAPASPAPAAAAVPTADEAAWRALAERWKLPADAIDGEAALCRVARDRGLACHRARAGLAALRRLDRPALLWLDGGSGEGATRLALLEGLDRDGARLRLGAVEQDVPIATLQARWRGEFATLWRPPPGWVAPQIDGRETPAAKWVAERLGRLQRNLPAMITAAEAAASDPLARDAAFEARVRAFQRSQGLVADGVLGPMTLMQLNRAAGIDEPRLARADGG